MHIRILPEEEGGSESDAQNILEVHLVHNFTISAVLMHVVPVYNVYVREKGAGKGRICILISDWSATLTHAFQQLLIRVASSPFLPLCLLAKKSCEVQ